VKNSSTKSRLPIEQGRSTGLAVRLACRSSALNRSTAGLASGYGITPQAVIVAAKLPFAITHAPGRMLVTDLKNAQLAVHEERTEKLS
jgi:uncharacterized protein YcsI (UPF0317 family)